MVGRAGRARRRLVPVTNAPRSWNCSGDVATDRLDHTYAVAAIEALLDQRYPARTGWAVLGAPLVRTVVVEAMLALWVDQRGFGYDRGDVDAACVDTAPEGFASLLDFAVAAEEHRLRVGWSSSDGSDGFDEDR